MQIGWMDHFTRWAQQHRRDFFLWVALSRLILLPVRVWVLFWLPYRSEYLFWWEMMTKYAEQNYLPYLHYWSEYPPLMPWLVTGIYHVSQWCLDGQVGQACFYLLYGLLLIAAELGALALLYRLAQRLEQPAAIQGVIWYEVSFLPLYIWSGWWDNLPLLLMLAAWLLFLDGHKHQSAILVGLGMLTKMFPTLLLPLAICALPTWRHKITYTGVVLVTVMLIILPLAWINTPMTVASFQNIATRPAWETIWALLDGYYGYGSVAPLDQRLDTASAREASHISSLPWGAITLVFGLFFAALYLLLWTRNHRQQDDPRFLTVAITLSIGLLLLYSKGYSPQYLLWIAPFLVVISPTRKMAWVLAVLFGVNLIELPVYINFFPDQVWLLFGTVIVRTALMVWLVVTLANDLLKGWRGPHAHAPAIPG